MHYVVSSCCYESQDSFSNSINWIGLGELHGYCIYYKDFWFRYQSYCTEINLAEILRKGQIKHTCPFVLPVTSKIFRRELNPYIYSMAGHQPNFHYRISVHLYFLLHYINHLRNIFAHMGSAIYCKYSFY